MSGKSLDEIVVQSNKHMIGNERFTNNGEETELTVLEYWRWLYSEVYDLQDTIAEYIVGKALGFTEAQNIGYWTLYDMKYRGKRIEIKETSYYHAWQTDEEKKSNARVFGITKAHNVYQDSSSPKERQNDVYIFCLNTGMTRAESNPLELNNWEFYVVPTKLIDEKCGDGKTISLSRLKKFVDAVTYDELKTTVDALIDIAE